jgi:hypothetical protein
MLSTISAECHKQALHAECHYAECGTLTTFECRVHKSRELLLNSNKTHSDRSITTISLIKSFKMYLFYIGFDYSDH